MSLWQGHRTASLLSPVVSVTLGREWHLESHPDLEMPQVGYYAEVTGPAPFQAFFDLGRIETILASGITGGF